jgi:hypothetical protein
MRPYAALATIAGLAVCQSLGAAETSAPLEGDTEKNEPKWEFSLSTFTYLAQHARDYVNPNLTADRDWLHLEARYNYEELKTGSVWLGWNLSTGTKLEFEVTPMVGGGFWRHNRHRTRFHHYDPLQAYRALLSRRILFRRRNKFWEFLL